MEDKKYDDLFLNNENNNVNIENELNNNRYCNKIHIRYQKRNKRKGITTIEGIELDKEKKKKFIKNIKKQFCCSGCEKKNEEGNDIFQFQGDHRTNLKLIIETEFNIESNDIIIHGI